ncbi:MAG: hypothetical protein Fur0018_11200 [Anaerolineales bacterium]
MASLSQKLHAEGEKTLAFFRALGAEDWQRPVYSEGAEWTVRDILAHIASAESSIPRLIRALLEEGRQPPPDFDLDAYNRRKVREMAEMTPEALLALFEQRRAATVALVEGLSEADLQRVGRHPFLGEAPVEEMLKLIYRHIQIHQRDIRRTLNRDAA